MNGSPTFQGLTSQALDEHRQIHFFLDRVQRALESLGGELPDVEPLRRMAAEIDGLRERLIEHQQTEERGGMFQAILDALPACRVEVERLTSQHTRMIEVLEMARLHALGGHVAEAAALREDLARFLGIFRSHEQEEERLFSRALQREARGGD